MFGTQVPAGITTKNFKQRTHIFKGHFVGVSFLAHVISAEGVGGGGQFFMRFRYSLLLVNLYFSNLFFCKAATLSSNSVLFERSRPTSLSVPESLQTKSIKGEKKMTKRKQQLAR